MTKHTQEPWRWQEAPHPTLKDHVGYEIVADTEHGLGIVAEVHVRPRLAIVRPDNVQRIVACVNAFGPDGAATKLLTALAWEASVCGANNREAHIIEGWQDSARAILATLQGEG